jgi:hypothetical protein
MEGINYWFGEPSVFVKTMSTQAIEQVLKAVVNEDRGKWLSVYGSLQSGK